MTAPEESPLLAWEEVLPVAFVPGTVEVDERLLAHRVAANLRVLHTCEALEERRAERDDESTGSPEIARLEQKVDLLIEMVGHLVSQAGSRPPAVVASLSGDGVRWRGTAPIPEAGSLGMVEIHPREGVAEALRLPGRIVDSGADGRVALSFEGLAEAELDAIERFVFRQHRRKIAGRRRVP